MEPIPYEVAANAFMVIFAALGVFLTVYNVYKAARDIKKPHDEHIAQVENHDKDIQSISRKLDELQGELHMMLDGHILLLDHEITGNHVSKLQGHRDRVMRYLINHGRAYDDHTAA